MRLRYFIIILYTISIIWPFFIYPLDLALIAVFLIAYFYNWVFVIPLLFWSFFNSLYIEKNSISKNFDKNKKYIAVVITTSYISKYNFFKLIPIHANGLFFLIKHMEKKKVAYKIFNRADIATFKDIIYDNNCYGMYILGHGMRYGLIISKNEIINYQNFANAPKKEFIVQLHCNHGYGKSLVDYLATDKKKSYAGNTTRNTFDDLFYFFVLYLENKFVLNIIYKILGVTKKEDITIDKLSF
jgi:hypothetical protein